MQLKRKNSTLCWLMMMGMAPALYAQRPPAVKLKKYQLVWADEFSKDGPPDPANWDFEQGFVRNHEAQWYQPQNAFCKDGLLVIEARRTNLPSPVYDSSATDWRRQRKMIAYTSASLNTRGLKSWTYGRFVMRARIATAAGLWPAFWTLGLSKPWPFCGEIDIMEYYNKQLLANIACGDKPGKPPRWISRVRRVDGLGKGWAGKFHNWRMDWDRQAISLYVDDQLISRVSLSELVNRDGSGFNPFAHPQYLLLNLAVGGDKGGDPGHTTFPRRFEIDYVRVYQRKE